jgi:TPP-dependent pyruvate/acetoin dehydrogenase alpha subunit
MKNLLNSENLFNQENVVVRTQTGAQYYVAFMDNELNRYKVVLNEFKKKLSEAAAVSEEKWQEVNNDLHKEIKDMTSVANYMYNDRFKERYTNGYNNYNGVKLYREFFKVLESEKNGYTPLERYVNTMIANGMPNEESIEEYIDSFKKGIRMRILDALDKAGAGCDKELFVE